MKKKLVSMLMAASMAAAFLAGCGNSEEVPAGGGTGSQQEGVEDGDEDEEMEEIVVAWMSFSPMDDSKTDAVEEAVNQVTEAEINTHVDIMWFDPNTYGTQIPMMIQGGEQLDLMMYTPVPNASFGSFKNQNQLMEIGSLISEYAPAVEQTLGSLLGSTSTQEGVYGIPSYYGMVGYQYINMREDILENLGLTEKARNMKSWTEFEEILTEVVEKTDIAGICNADAAGTVLNTQPFFMGSDSFSENYCYDGLGDTNLMIYVDQDTAKVGCYYFSEEYQKMMKRVNDWYKKGLVYKDSATSQELGATLFKNDVSFSYTGVGELGAEATAEAGTGKDVVSVPVTGTIMGTSAGQKFGFAVPVTSKAPEATMKFVNLLFTNETVANTLAWGVEGRDWVRTDDGFAAYPEGVTADTVIYHTSDFLNGNQQIVLPWEGQEADIREQQAESMEQAEYSRFMGFAFDSTGYENEMTACYNVGEQYRSGLASGSVEYESTYQAFVDALKAAGIETIVAAYQEQLDAWLATQE